MEERACNTTDESPVLELITRLESIPRALQLEQRRIEITASTFRSHTVRKLTSLGVANHPSRGGTIGKPGWADDPIM